MTASPMRAAAKPSWATRPTNSSFSFVKPKPLMPKNYAGGEGSRVSSHVQADGSVRSRNRIMLHATPQTHSRWC